MIAALKALQRSHERTDMPEELAAFGINEGQAKKLFMSHPALEKPSSCTTK